MGTNRVILASLAGIGFTAVLALALDIPAAPIEMLAFVLLAPGMIVASQLFRMRWLGSPLPGLIFSGVIYAAVAFLILHRLRYRPTKTKTLIIAAVVVPLACVACIPSLSPLWPHGMSELGQKEQVLREGLRAGLDLTSAQAFLRRQGIDSYQFVAKSEEVVMQRANVRIVAEPSDQVLYARVPTGAEQFPCSYRTEVVLVFDQQEKLKQSYIARFPICP